MMNKFDQQTLEKIEQFVDKNPDYYINVFSGINHKGRKFSFNTSVLFFGSFWFLYRRMYVVGSIFLIMPIVLLVFLLILFKSSFSFSEYDTVIIYIVLLGFRLFITSIANYLYWKKFLEYQGCVKSRENSQSVVGTNNFAPIIACIVFFLFFCWLLSGMMQGMRHT